MLIYLSLLDTEEEKSKFEQIYNNYKLTMFYVAKSILKDDYLSEDAVHDAFINIAKSMDNISDVISSRTKGYVVIIVRNISFNILKKQKPIVEIEDFEENVSYDISLEDEILSKLSFDFIIEEIMNLPVIYKDVLYLSYVEELSTQEISILINISNEAVKKRLQRGRRKLAENIKEAM
ncbi:RNA polymerase sigma factor [Sedimentibacter hydroxybenzoicus DSM 7310]|uniref:RNA polymerase sigma factor n=1 Tax=Sedimentibacter hydroxybenzoicus DSM 7310 TaxID=1123245 RepID=A0A974GW16_SEDHY|nr:RNA polymerase sigma factor [Sedimentibacter hydroxybenzoicus]NYB73600.1 RNA polymerase sigma factor [Sedimentibacter hydroxybenzoicus DSM 7310]